MPALPPCILEPLWHQFAALLPTRQLHHPLGGHRPRIPDRVAFDKLIQVLVFGCATAASPGVLGGDESLTRRACALRRR